MQITFTGVKSKALQDELARAAEYFADILMDPRMVRNITLDIEVRKNMDVMGECVDEEGTRNPRWFTIGLKSQKSSEMIKTLAHEMVHVKQHAKNELQSGVMIATRGGLKMSSRWKGEIWNPKRKECPYYDSPWEVEAYGKEVGLFQRYVAWVEQECKKTKQSI